METANNGKRPTNGASNGNGMTAKAYGAGAGAKPTNFAKPGNGAAIKPANGAAIKPANGAAAAKSGNGAAAAKGPAATGLGMRGQNGGLHLAERYAVNEENLALRKEFLRLGDDDRKLMTEMIPWATEMAETIAREFYDWQFSFGPTREFFTGYARKRSVSLTTLRAHLEGAQTKYFRSVFEGARRGWDVEYFEVRLHIGWVHDQINLPFKWYIGAYAEFTRLAREHLTKRFDDAAHVTRVLDAMQRVFNLDIQAVGDSFLMNTLESTGLSIDDVDVAAGSDKTEHIDQLKTQVSTMLEQAQALADRKISDKTLDDEVSGRLGSAIHQITASLRDVLGQMGRGATDLAAASEHLTGISQSLDSGAEQAASQAGAAAAAATQVSANVQTVAASSEEMTASIREIAKSASEASRVAGTAVKVAETTNATVAKLGESSAEIGKVIKVITSIAQQTNLLALNATIEAARAGEAGKGFAVVANEVKELAKETARASEDIGQRIDAVQASTRSAVAAIAQIGEIIGQISDIQSTIATAVEEQTATTNEISRNVAEAARGSADIAQNINSVATAAQGTQAGATNALRSAADLARLASELQRQLALFS